MNIKVSIRLLFFVLNISSIQSDENDLPDNKVSAKINSFLGKVNKDLAKQLNEATIADWAYEVDINNKTAKEKTSAESALNEFRRKLWSETKGFNISNMTQKNRRLFEKMSVIGIAALEKEDENTYHTVTNNMQTIYSSAKVCVSGKCELELDPDLSKIMAESTNYTELLEAWVNWRDASGKKMRNNFITYYTLGNKAAKLNRFPNKKFENLDDLWLFPWETPDLKDQMAALLEQFRPFYEKLHAYIRMKLGKKYRDKMPRDGTIPAHLLGNMWAQTWDNIMKTVEGVDPYPNLTTIDVTKTLKEQGFTSKKMFQISEKFFTELGLEKMTDKFWKNSILDKSKDKVMVCHASAFDFYVTDDFRIKMCTNINMEDLITIHHEMGHIQYYQQYKNQHILFRDGANPGFHEAIGDVLALSVVTPKHLKKIKLLQMDESSKLKDDVDDAKRYLLKFQLKMGLEKIMFLPFGYLMDKWRWDVFSGDVSSNDMNRHWWRLTGKYQGISPPVKRSEEDFDPGAKFHIPADIEYFAALILQFQFHKKLCSFGQKDVPLYACDIDGDVEAGDALKKMLQKGSSEKWTEQLNDFVGTPKMDIKPLLDYFEPLNDYLDKQLIGYKTGWTFNVDDYFKSSSTALAFNMSLFMIYTLIAIQLN